MTTTGHDGNDETRMKTKRDAYNRLTNDSMEKSILLNGKTHGKSREILQERDSLLPSTRYLIYPLALPLRIVLRLFSLSSQLTATTFLLVVSSSGIDVHKSFFTSPLLLFPFFI